MTVKDESLKQNRQRNCIIEIGNSLDENITNYITSIDVNHSVNGDNYLLTEVNPSTAGFQVRNYGDYFKNKQLSKLPVRIKSGYNGLNDEVFRGYLKRDSYRVGSKELSLSSESYLQVFKKEIINKEVLDNFFIEDIVERAIQECVIDGTPYELQKTGIRIPICNLNEFQQWSDLLKLLIPASLFVLLYEDAKFVFRKFWDSTKSSVYSFDVDNIKELVQTKSIDDIKNSILLISNYKSVAPKDKLSENLANQTTVENEPYYIQEGYNNRIKVQNFPLYKDQVLVDGEYKYKTDTTVFIVDPNSSRFGQKVLITDIDVDNGYIYLAENLQAGLKLSVSYKYLQLQLNPGQERTYTIELSNEGKNIQLLCAAWKNTEQFDNGERVPYSTIPTSDVVHLTNAIEQKDNKIRFTLKNNTTSIITMSTLQAYGNPIKAFSPIKAKYKNPTSVTKYGEKVLEINNDFIVSEQQARDLGVFLYSNCSELVEKIEIQLPQHMPFLKIGDKVTVTENSTSINYDFMITSIRHSYNENEWSTSFNAIKYPILLEDIVPEYLSKDNQGDYITSTLFNDTPLPSPSNLVVKYNNNTDGTKNISLSWADTDDIASPRDGYEIFISTKNQSGSFTVDFQNDIHFEIRPESRAMILRNLPFKETIDSTDFFKYYAFAIRPFRNVHPEISPDKTGILRGDISYFDSNYKKIDEFTLYNGSTIEQSVNGVIETTSISILNTMLKSFEKDKQYDNSIMFSDFSGFKQFKDGRLIKQWGQIEPGVYGEVQYNGDSEEIYRFDGQNLNLTNINFTNTKTDKKSRIINNPTDGIKIQKNTGSSLVPNWVDKLFADTDGNLIANDLIANNMTAKQLKITDGTDAVLIDSNTKTIDFSKFTTIAGQLKAENIDTSGITASNLNVTKSDNKAKININPTDGIKIQQNVSGFWVDKFYVDSNGALQAEDLTAKKIKISDGSDNVLIDANTKTIDFSKFTTTVGNITGVSFLSQNSSSAYCKIEGSYLESKGTYTRSWQGASDTNTISMRLDNGYFKVSNQTKSRALFYSDYGISTQLDGRGSAGSSGTIEFFSDYYAGQTSNLGITMYSDTGIVGLVSTKSFVQISPEWDNAGYNTYSFQVLDNVDNTKTDGLLFYGSHVNGWGSCIRFGKSPSNPYIALQNGSGIWGACDFYCDNLYAGQNGGYLTVGTGEFTMRLVPTLGAGTVIFHDAGVNNREFIFCSDTNDQPSSFYFCGDKTIPTDQTTPPTANANIHGIMINTSLRKTKKNIEALKTSMLQKVMNTTVYSYEDIDAKVNYPYYERIGFKPSKKHGLIFEEAPEELKTTPDGINLYSMISVLWKAVQELTTEVNLLKGKKEI